MNPDEILDRTLNNKEWMFDNEHLIREILPVNWIDIRYYNPDPIITIMNEFGIPISTNPNGITIGMILGLLENKGLSVRDGIMFKRNDSGMGIQ